MRSLFFLFLMTISLSAFANETRYILFDPNCMDRLEYQHNDSPTKYITYQVHTSNGIIALEVGVENAKDYTVLPKGAKGCGNKSFDETFVRAINNNVLDVYVIMPASAYGHYTISPARMASYMSNDLQAGKMIRPDYEFDYSANTLTAGTNLATSFSESQVFFMDEGSKCEAYHFRSISKNTCRPMTEVYYLHGVGIVNEKIGKNLEEENKNQYTLTKINGVSLDKFKAAHCKGNRIQLGLAPKPVLAAKAVAPKKTKAKAFVPKKCNNLAEADHHLVQYGENLYSIARREGLTIRQLRKWNSLKSNKILACSQLRVIPPTPKYTAAPKKKAKKKFTAKGTKKAKKYVAKKSVAKKPAKKFVNTHKPVKSDNGVHIVQKNENLYMLATLYGYTVERFAHMNGLENGAVIQPGMKLFTTDCSCDTETVVKHETVLAPKSVEVEEKEMPVLAGSMEIPAERVVASPEVTSHIVQEGETIWSIANFYGFNTQKLMDRNNLEVGEVLIPGQKIYFPR